jgi:hypothetical protein
MRASRLTLPQYLADALPAITKLARTNSRWHTSKRMAQIQILNPNDQPTDKWRLINELRACLVSDDFHTLLLAVAFAKTGPLLRLKTEIERWLAQGKTIIGIFGVNHRNTSKQALEFALDKFTEAHVLFHSNDFTYHPKMYLFIGQQKCKFFIGSHNLTVGGTETNWESGAVINLHLPEDEQTLIDAKAGWDSLLALSAELNTPLIQRYETLGMLADESVRRKHPAASRQVGNSAPVMTDGPPRVKLKIKPPSPLPKELFVQRQARTRVAGPRAKTPKRTHAKVSTEALVIQVVPHHNGEVFLSKLAVDQNPDFFGFPFTGRTTPKKPTNPSYPQREPDPIVDLKVYGDRIIGSGSQSCLTMRRFKSRNYVRHL